MDFRTYVRFCPPDGLMPARTHMSLCVRTRKPVWMDTNTTEQVVRSKFQRSE